MGCFVGKGDCPCLGPLTIHHLISYSSFMYCITRTNITRMAHTIADPDRHTAHDRATPLHAVCEKGRVDVARVLLGGEADPNQVDIAGSTPLLYASAAGHTRLVEALLEARADTERVDVRTGETALGVASKRGHGGVVWALLEAGASHRVVDGSGRTPLHAACRTNHGLWVEKGGEGGGEGAGKKEGGWSATVSALLEHGADPGALDRDGVAPSCKW